MRNLIRILALVFVLTITGASAMAVPAFALETTGNYNSNEVSFDSENNVTHAIGVQNFETPEPEVILMSADSNIGDDVAVSEVADTEQEESNDTPVYEVGDEPMEVSASGNYITVNLKQDGYYFFSLEKLTGDGPLILGVHDSNGRLALSMESVNNKALAEGYLSAGKYIVYVSAFEEGDITALFSVKNGILFDENDAELFKVGDTINVSAGAEKQAYKLDMSKIIDLGDDLSDAFVITATGADPKVTIKLYDENLKFIGLNYNTEDGVGSQLYVYPDDLNEVYYITVEQESGGSDFALSGNSVVGMLLEDAQPIELDEVNEISFEECKSVIEFPNETFEYIYYFGIGIHSFVPETDGYYSVNFKNDCAFDVDSFLVDSNGLLVGSEVFSYSCDKGSQAEMVVYLEAGETYGLISIIYMDENSRLTVDITACDK